MSDGIPGPKKRKAKKRRLSANANTKSTDAVEAEPQPAISTPKKKLTEACDWKYLAAEVKSCEAEVFAQKWEKWFSTCLRPFQRATGEHTNAACAVFVELFGRLPKFPDLCRDFSTSKLKSLVSLLMSNHAFDPSGPLKVALQCLQHFSASMLQTGSSNNRHFKSFLAKLISSQETQLFAGVADCVARFPTGHSGGPKRRAAWHNQVKTCVVYAHNALKVRFEMLIEHEDCPLDSDQPFTSLSDIDFAILPDLREPENPKAALVRFEFWLLVLERMLQIKAEHPVDIPLDLLWLLISCASRVRKLAEPGEYGVLRKSFHLLRILIATLKLAILPLNSKIMDLALECLKKPMLKCDAYALLECMALHLGLASKLGTQHNTLLMHSMNDLGDCGNAALVKCCMQFNCALLKTQTIMISAKYFQQLQERVLLTLLDFQSRNQYLPVRRHFYQLLLDLIVNAHPQYPPGIHLALPVFSQGCRDPDPEVSELCARACTLCSVLARPRLPSLETPILTELPKKTELALPAKMDHKDTEIVAKSGPILREIHGAFGKLAQIWDFAPGISSGSPEKMPERSLLFSDIEPRSDAPKSFEQRHKETLQDVAKLFAGEELTKDQSGHCEQPSVPVDDPKSSTMLPENSVVGGDNGGKSKTNPIQDTDGSNVIEKKSEEIDDNNSVCIVLSDHELSEPENGEATQSAAESFWRELQARQSEGTSKENDVVTPGKKSESVAKENEVVSPEKNSDSFLPVNNDVEKHPELMDMLADFYIE